jgi:opacity protein-like surface antigen
MTPDRTHRAIFRGVEWRALFIGLATLAVTAPALADEDEASFYDPGFYVGVSGVYTHNFFDGQVDSALEDAIGQDVDVSIDDSWGINARVGYRAASWFAIEAHYEYIDEFDVKAKIKGLIPNQKIFSIEGHTLTANTRWIIPLWRTQPYILLGAGYSLYESDVVSNPVVKQLLGSGGKQSGFAGRGGGGIDLYLTEHLVANAEATALLTTQDFGKRDTGNIDDLWYVSLGAGLRYQF